MKREQKQRARREQKRRAYRAQKKRPARPIDPSWNLGKERGPEVTRYEVALHALDGHPKCRGSGMVGNQNCSCAQKRFLKANQARIVLDEKGRAWWVAGAQPNAPKPESAA